MKILSIVLFALLAKIVVPETTGTEQLDLNDIDRNDSLWMKLFARIDTVLNETNKLAEGQIILNKRLDTQELKLAQLTEISLNHTVDVNKSLNDQERKQTDFMENTETHFKDLNRKLDALMQCNHQKSDWTTILRRQDGSVDFYRNWTEYQKGFGNPDGEFFIGLERLHAMTSAGASQELIVILRDFKNQEKIAKYDLFRIGNEAEKYAIKELGAYRGDAGNCLLYHKDRKFSTYDQDNDSSTYSCAERYEGAWWFDSCYRSHLFGPYKSEKESNTNGVTWYRFKNDHYYSLKFAEMKIRPKKF